MLLEECEKRGFSEINIALEEAASSDEDPVIVYVNFPTVFTEQLYINPRVKIELGCRSLREPFENRVINALVEEHFGDQEFALPKLLET